MALENCHLATIIEAILIIDLGVNHPWRLKVAHESKEEHGSTLKVF